MMAVSGLSHAEIETEFDRFLLLQAGKDPLRAHLTQHIHPTRDRARVIADFFPTLTTEQIFQALCSMIRYHKPVSYTHLTASFNHPSATVPVPRPKPCCSPGYE